MTSRRATRRRREEARVPVIPGVIPDRSEASIEMAMRQAHEELPEVRNTRVHLQLFEPAVGLGLIADHFGSVAVSIMQQQLAKIGGSEPTIVLAARLHHHHEQKDPR